MINVFAAVVAESDQVGHSPGAVNQCQFISVSQYADSIHAIVTKAREFHLLILCILFARPDHPGNRVIGVKHQVFERASNVQQDEPEQEQR